MNKENTKEKTTIEAKEDPFDDPLEDMLILDDIYFEEAREGVTVDGMTYSFLKLIGRCITIARVTYYITNPRQTCKPRRSAVFYAAHVFLNGPRFSHILWEVTCKKQKAM